MKLIRCKNCNDVVRLVHTKWRKCDCGQSGGQYNNDFISATVGGNCEVIGIRNDFFENSREDRVALGIDGIIQGEYFGDLQIHRVKEPTGPRLKMKIRKIEDTVELTFIDKREYRLNVPDNKSPKIIILPFNDTPSFKDKTMR